MSHRQHSHVGCRICRMPRERFFQFSWRPRPPTLLEPAKEEEVVKNLKKYSQKYEQEDQALLAQVMHFLVCLRLCAPACLVLRSSASTVQQQIPASWRLNTRTALYQAARVHAGRPACRNVTHPHIACIESVALRCGLWACKSFCVGSRGHTCPLQRVKCVTNA